jgi:oligopeptide transport system ATP-binding protein
MEPLLKVTDLKKWYQSGQETVHAVNGLSLTVHPGEAVALVGESGCGKSTTARCVLRLTDPTDGQILFDGQEIGQMAEKRFRPFRQRIQMVFQDPTTSMNPRFTVRRTLEEPLRLHGLAKGEELNRRVSEVLTKVQLGLEYLDRYPRQLSGGQRQRVVIARALMTSPQLVVLDEPTSALDMSVKFSVVELLRNLQTDLNMAYLLITHDMSTVRHLCSRVMVMYMGKIVESGPTEQIFDQPRHPYTQSLLSAIPIPDPTVKRERIRLRGDAPSLVKLPRGCPLAERCPVAEARCSESYPAVRNLPGGHQVACHLVEE